MKNAYRISGKAIEDLENIWFYTFETWSVEQADRYYNLIIDEVQYVCDDFESGTNMQPIRLGYRAAKVKSHLISYKNGDDEILEVIRILHQRTDIENRLK